MKPQRMYLVAVFVLLLTSLGFAESQEDARDAPKRLGEEEAFSQGGTLTVWVPNSYVMGRMNDPTVRVVNAYPWGILQSEFKRTSLTLIWT